MPLSCRMPGGLPLDLLDASARKYDDSSSAALPVLDQSLMASAAASF